MKGKRGFSFLLLLVFIVLGCIRLANAANIPKEAKIHNQLGNEYCDKGEFNRGVEEYEKAVELNPDYTDALYNLCMTCYLDLKDYEKAIYYIKRFLEIESETPDAKQVKKWLDDAEQKVAAQKKSAPPAKVVKKEKTEPPQKTIEAAKPLRPKDGQPTSLAKDVPVRPTPKVAGIKPLPKEKPVTGVSQEEEAREYKKKGNEYNRLGKSEEAVKYYLKALEIYPAYPDALYNIAKTYDFDLKDYAQAIHYYKQFLKYEPPTSRDAAQVKVWLGRVEKVYGKQKKKAKSKPPAPKVKIASTPPVVEEVVKKRETVVGGEKLAGFITKGLLRSTRDEVKKPGEIKKVASQIKSQVAEPTEMSTPQPVKGVVASAPKKIDIPSSFSGRVADNRQIVIEAVIPRDLMGTKWVSLGMERMQQEIVKFLAANKVKSPQKLAELYASKIQSDILPSGEKVSYFRLEGSDLSDLPYVSILTQKEKRNLEREKWELIRTRKSPARLREVLTILRNGYKIDR